MNTFSCKEANALDLVDYLVCLGHTPQKVRGSDYWYLSPLRPERTPSFKVSRQLNVWYDHGDGRGGTLVDFGLLYFSCSLPQLLDRIGGQRLHGAPLFRTAPAAAEGGPSPLQICEMRPLTSLALQRYLHRRKIPLSLARHYLCEVVFSVHGKRHLALGFANRSGGYELRNEWFKGSSAPKDVSTYFHKGREVAVFEGFFDFLSFLAIHQKQVVPRLDFLVLNSLSFAAKNRELLAPYRGVRLYLDHDKAGDTHVQQLLKACPAATDERTLYRGYKDLNDWFVHMGKGNRPRQHPSFHPP